MSFGELHLKLTSSRKAVVLNAERDFFAFPFQSLMVRFISREEVVFCLAWQQMYKYTKIQIISTQKKREALTTSNLIGWALETGAVE